ncbi:MAG: homoserine O-acetyltransferase, partial [Magnetococcales bacterium]|nr:homoserine O-acetyltransferase [Magnetococcales bacterium]
TDTLGTDTPLTLDCGESLSNFVLSYQTYGTLNAAKDNAILICHALSGDQYAASQNPAIDPPRPGWWETMIGPDRPINTNNYFVICSNVLGGCMGSTGPSSVNHDTGKIWGADFPVITIGDMVAAQERLVTFLGIDRLHAVVGGSMGGMQSLEWMRRFPERLCGVVALATSYRQGVQGIAFHEAGRQAIMNDPAWNGGAYQELGTFPVNGLAVARMVAHVTYLSEKKLSERFGRQLSGRNFKSYSNSCDFQIQSYLHHQGFSFTKRFDPNTYLYVTRAIDYFNQAEEYGDNLDEAYLEALDRYKPPVCLISVSSDWTYPPSESSRIETALRHAGVSVRHRIIESDDGHDAFLLPNNDIEGDMRYFLSHVIKASHS